MVFVKEDYTEMSLKIGKVKEEVGKFIVGQEEAVDFILYSILAGGHTLLEGLPGLGKTMLIRTFSEVLDLSFSRIQFTPDLMPSDITGTTVIEEMQDGRKNFVFREGPLFSEMVLADEINRATPKTQSALLEAMGERTVTILGNTRPMKDPFFVLATQNPIELEGTYPLPEAQLDRFLCKVIVPHPGTEELKEIIRRTTGGGTGSLGKLLDPGEIRHAREMVREVILPEEMLDVATRIVTGTHPSDTPLDEVKRWVRFGSGPRGLQSLVLAAKARALTEGRFHVSIGDLKKCAVPVLRHRLLFNYEGEAAGMPADDLIIRLADLSAEGHTS